MEIHSKNDWEKLLDKFANADFLQSWLWGEFQEQSGNIVFRLSLAEENSLSLSQCYIVNSRFSKFLYCPRGPLSSAPHCLSLLIEHIIILAKEHSVDFILLEPSIESDDIAKIIEKKGFSRQTSSTQPEHTSVVLLEPDLNSIYSSFRKTTRHMIRGALEINVTIESYDDLSHWKDFLPLLNETAHRQKFTPHSFSYIKKQFLAFEKEKNVKLYLATYDKKAIAGAVILSYRKTSTYLHAASGILSRDSGASQLLVWQAIQDAKRNGNRYFDLWGVAPEHAPHHPWSGISIFKRGFGGNDVLYPGSFILPINKFRYMFYRLINFLRYFPVFKKAQRVLLRRIIRG